MVRLRSVCMLEANNAFLCSVLSACFVSDEVLKFVHPVVKEDCFPKRVHSSHNIPFSLSLILSRVTMKQLRQPVISWSPYLTAIKSCKWCGARETRPLLVTTVGLTEPDGGSSLGESGTGSVCLGWPARLFWTGWPVSWGLIDSAAAGAMLDGLSSGGQTKLVSEVWPNGFLDLDSLARRRQPWILVWAPCNFSLIFMRRADLWRLDHPELTAHLWVEIRVETCGDFLLRVRPSTDDGFLQLLKSVSLNYFCLNFPQLGLWDREEIDCMDSFSFLFSLRLDGGKL